MYKMIREEETGEVDREGSQGKRLFYPLYGIMCTRVGSYVYAGTHSYILICGYCCVFVCLSLFRFLRCVLSYNDTITFASATDDRVMDRDALRKFIHERIPEEVNAMLAALAESKE